MWSFLEMRQFGILQLQNATKQTETIDGVEVTKLLIDMPMYWVALSLVVIGICAYLLGSLNFAVLISRNRYHDDIRLHGSKNAGTTNMMRTYGSSSAALTFAGDAAKGLVSCAIGGMLMGQTGAAVACLFCIIGHVFPCFFGFRGGKGVAVAAATVLWINPLVFLFVILIFVGVVWWTKYLSLGSIMATAIYPVLLFSFTPTNYRGIPNVIAVVVAVFIVYLHRANIVRLWNGNENKFKFKKSVKVAPATEAPSDSAEEE